MRQDSITSVLATFALGLNFRELPRQVVHNAKLRLLDTVGVCLASSGMDYADAVLAYVQEQGGKPDACLFGRPGRFPAALSVLYNGALAHGNDYDDTHSQSIVHPGGVIVPTALAISEKLLLTGEQAIVAIVAGYEIAARIGMAASKGFHAQGFHPTGVCGALASAATASVAMGLAHQQFVSALGIAGSQASGSLEFLSDGAWTKRLHPGWAAHSGVVAASLARNGFTGPATILEGKHGLYALYATRTQPDLSLATRALGQEWEILNTDFKPYPCGHISHPYMDCALQLRRDRLVSANDIAAIELRVPSAVVPILCEPVAEKRRPRSPYASRFSLPFSTALIFATGSAGIDDFSDERLADPVIQALCDKTHYVVDESLPFPQTFPGWVIVTLKSGARLEARLDASRGSRENPMSEDDLYQKFESNVTRSFSRGRAQQIWQTGLSLETLPNLRAFTDLLGT